MLASETKKLRWMGIDMRPRWRRRVAVVTTYAVFQMLIGSVATLATNGHLFGHRYLTLVAMVGASMCWFWLSVFRSGGVVKNFDDPAVFRGGKYMIVGSLDEWARYKYGATGFEQTTKEQQTELLRTYRVGNYLVPAKLLEDYRLDERERAERDRITRWALNTLVFLLCIMTGTTALNRIAMAPSGLSALLWNLAVLAITLPQARVLWTEPDPRNDEEGAAPNEESNLGTQ